MSCSSLIILIICHYPIRTPSKLREKLIVGVSILKRVLKIFSIPSATTTGPSLDMASYGGWHSMDGNKKVMETP